MLIEISRPFIDEQVTQALAEQGRLIYDGDLTGRPVSSTSTTYPDTAYGYMDDEVRLGYLAAGVSIRSPTHGRNWLAVKPHPGNLVSCGCQIAASRGRAFAAEWGRFRCSVAAGFHPRLDAELVQHC